MERIWRYSINVGECGGIVIADTKEEATLKVENAYKRKDIEVAEILVWSAVDSEEYDRGHSEVLEIY